MANHFGEDWYPHTFRNSWDLFIAKGQPPAIISVRNLQATIRVGKDAWGREGKVQPVLISATVSLRQPFDSASVHDLVNPSTIHYGTLSKVILEAVQEFHDQGGVSTQRGKDSSVKALLDHVDLKLTSFSLDGKRRPNFNDLEPGGGRLIKGAETFLDPALVKALELEVTLPKGLLNSTTGVSRISTTVRSEIDDFRAYQEYWGSSIVLRNLQVSTLIGVNSNERLAKQLVIATIETDVWATTQDVYNQLEEVAVKVSKHHSWVVLKSTNPAVRPSKNPPSRPWSLLRHIWLGE